MVEKKGGKKKIDEDLPDYDAVEFEDIDENGQDAPANGQQPKANAQAKPSDYVGVHSTSFKDMLLKPELQQAIVDCGFEHPSDVQQKCIPESILGVDVLCQAVSGMGKTAVFVLTVLQCLPEEPEPVSALILCHNRELAYQIKGEFDRMSRYMKTLRSSVIYGGEPLAGHQKLFKGAAPPHVVVGTPGRVLALVKDKTMPTKNIKMFILDECDRVLESVSMRSDIQRIFKDTPVNKQVMMFTATLSNDIKLTCRKFMQNPREILIENDRQLTLHGLKQYYVKLDEKEKISKLMDLIDQLQFNQVIIFVKSVKYAMKLAEVLVKNAIPSKAIHRDVPQEERIKIYEGFKQFKHRILVATEIFGRGIDIEKINIVFNYDMPDSADSYLHRVGRAGRFGTKGLAITFSSSDEDKTVLDEIQKRFEVKIEELPTTIDSTTYMNN